MFVHICPYLCPQWSQMSSEQPPAALKKKHESNQTQCVLKAYLVTNKWQIVKEHYYMTRVKL